MTRKIFAIFCIVALALEATWAAPTTTPTPEVSATTYAPFESRNLDELMKYLLHITIHKFDSKQSLVETRLGRFHEALDMLIEDAGASADEEHTKIYTEVRQAVEDGLKTIREESQTCGLYLVAMTKLGQITDLVANLKDSQLWNYWTFSNIDEKNLFISVRYPLEELDEYRESQRFFEKNKELETEAKAKADNFVNANCQKYKEFYADEAISN